MSIADDRAGSGAGKDRYAALAALLRARREELGLSRRALAESTGLSYPYIAQLEGGYRAPSVSTARRLAAALHLPVEDIVHAADEASPSAPPDLETAGQAWLPNPTYAKGIAETYGVDAPRPSQAPQADLGAAGGRYSLAFTPRPAPAASPAPAAAAPPPRRPRQDRGSPPTTPGTAPAARSAAEAARAIAALLHTLPAETRLDALALAQREVLTEIIVERSRRPSPDAETLDR